MSKKHSLSQKSSELLQESLACYGRTDNVSFTELKISNRFVRWLFNHYYCEWVSYNFYDSEPDLEEELYDMYLDYMYPLKGFSYSKGRHTEDELRQAFIQVNAAYKEYEPRRLEFNNWMEIEKQGSNGATQKDVDDWARESLIETKKCPTSYHNRLYYAKCEDGSISIFYFGRDVRMFDILWNFKKRARRKS